MDFDRGAISFSTAEGNGYSQPVKGDLGPNKTGRVNVRLDQVYQPRRFEPTDNVKLVDIPSKLLTTFHGRPVRLRAGVVLPGSFKNKPGQKYPVVYEIPGFGLVGRLEQSLAAGDVSRFLWRGLVHGP
jgi:hypothetical protein